MSGNRKSIDKIEKKIFNESFSTNGVGTTEHPHNKKVNLYRDLMFFTKITQNGL